MIQKILTIISITIIIICFPKITKAANIIFVENGEAKGIILLTSTNEELQEAAKELQRVIKKSSGVELPIVNSPQEGKNTLRITTYKEIGETLNIVKDGFKVYSPSSTEIVIQGGDEIGAANGIYHFLEQNIGVRWLQPGDDWTHIPQHNTISFPDSGYIEEPDFFSRSWFMTRDEGSNNPYVEYIAWRKKMRIMNHYNSRAKYTHNLYTLFPP